MEEHEYFLLRSGWIETPIQGLSVLFSEGVPTFAKLYAPFKADFRPLPEVQSTIQSTIDVLVGQRCQLSGWDWTGDVFGAGFYYCSCALEESGT